MRGEQLLCAEHGASGLGSPPLARGTVKPFNLLPQCAGITPACAGNRTPIAGANNLHGDHPRLRGEQITYTYFNSGRPGSPPLARGTVKWAGRRREARGITPACAGNSARSMGTIAVAWDHPRLRGEQLVEAPSFGKDIGSPPLARGTVYISSKIHSRIGITPACAGNSKPSLTFSRFIGDHPRLRGEQCLQRLQHLHVLGSPPLARGTVSSGNSSPPIHGITPACAGNSSGSSVSSRFCQDHPRLRGEQGIDLLVALIQAGSPPLARGTAQRSDCPAWNTGITPACAGNSASLRLRCPLFGDHPRLRGEQLAHAIAATADAGSPPLARGTGICTRQQRTLNRITPACAGNSYAGDI